MIIRMKLKWLGVNTAVKMNYHQDNDKICFQKKISKENSKSMKNWSMNQSSIYFFIYNF
jgi:hypothetical protein